MPTGEIQRIRNKPQNYEIAKLYSDRSGKNIIQRIKTLKKAKHILTESNSLVISDSILLTEAIEVELNSLTNSIKTAAITQADDRINLRGILIEQGFHIFEPRKANFIFDIHIDPYVATFQDNVYALRQQIEITISSNTAKSDRIRFIGKGIGLNEAQAKQNLQRNIYDLVSKKITNWERIIYE